MIKLIGLLGRNQQGVATCALTKWLDECEDEECLGEFYDRVEETVGTDFMEWYFIFRYFVKNYQAGKTFSKYKTFEFL